jgi:large subunit ribosomal protein L4
MRIPIFDAHGKRTQQILEFDEKIFGEEVAQETLRSAIIMFEARQRLGTHSTKTRGQCSGSGRKLWRQKGTGRARVGASRAPHWRGGGVVFGPHPRDYSYSIPKKAKKLALNSAWLAKFLDRKVMVIENFNLENVPKTKNIYTTLENIGVHQSRVLIGVSSSNEILINSVRNIPKKSIDDIVRFNSHNILLNEWILLTKDTFEKLIQSHGGTFTTVERAKLYPTTTSN